MIAGIDLGTTKSAVGIWDYRKQRVEIVHDDTGQLSIPSLLLITKDKHIFAGQMAKKHRDSI